MERRGFLKALTTLIIANAIPDSVTKGVKFMEKKTEPVLYVQGLNAYWDRDFKFEETAQNAAKKAMQDERDAWFCSVDPATYDNDPNNILCVKISTGQSPRIIHWKSTHKSTL